MSHSLVIVESPAKARTIAKYLGKGFSVKATVGHLRDLPKSQLGVDEEDSFRPTYKVIDGKAKVVAELKKAAALADDIYIATDPDREGEAIGWHLAEILRQVRGPEPNIQRILFNEITPRGVKDGMSKPREINQDRVDAQQARRILDRLVGYKLSPLLWKKVRRGLSAGRVQSVALLMIARREDEIEAFDSKEYWTISTQLKATEPPEVLAKLTKTDGKKSDIPNEELARLIEKELNSGEFLISSVKKRTRKKKPLAPFTTPKLQQAAASRHRFAVRRTMSIAQSLYEGKNVGDEGTVGLITYMRTDSVRIADEALEEIRDYVTQTWPAAEFLPEKPIIYKSKKSAQEGHEAIRPTSIERTPAQMAAYLSRDELNLYRLIWERTVMSQMTPALWDVTDVLIENGRHELKTVGETLRFNGHLIVQGVRTGADLVAAEEKEEGKEGGKASKLLPPLEEGEVLEKVLVDAKQNFTQPPARFSEATLVKALEENGIGRPSTYAAIISTLQSRDYTVKESNKIHPTALGRLVTTQLQGSFKDIINETYTAGLEEQLDEIEAGDLDWREALAIFSKKFEKDLVVAYEEMPLVKGQGIATDEVCEKCSSPMVIKFGRFGEFLACSGYPDCNNTRELSRVGEGEESEADSQPPCEKCQSKMVKKRGRYGPFFSCSAYPECKNVRKIQKGPKFDPKPTGVACPEGCGGEIFEKRSRKGGVFFGCGSYPKCTFALWNRPIAKPCPECAATFVVEKTTKRDGTVRYCEQEDCKYRENLAEAS